MGYNSIAWLPLTAGLTAIGMILSYYAYRRRGLRSALRWAAVSLLPIAAYLTGATIAAHRATRPGVVRAGTMQPNVHGLLLVQ